MRKHRKQLINSVNVYYARQFHCHWPKLLIQNKKWAPEWLLGAIIRLWSPAVRELEGCHDSWNFPTAQGAGRLTATIMRRWRGGYAALTADKRPATWQLTQENTEEKKTWMLRLGSETLILEMHHWNHAQMQFIDSSNRSGSEQKCPRSR